MKGASENLGVKLLEGLKEVTTPRTSGAVPGNLFRKSELGQAADWVPGREKSSEGGNLPRLVCPAFHFYVHGKSTVEDECLHSLALGSIRTFFRARSDIC